MQKSLFKKSLAFALSAAISLTALLGSLSVSAATGEGTIVAGTVTAAAGDTVTVPVTIDATVGNDVAAALFDLTFDDAALDIVSITAADQTANYEVAYKTTDGTNIAVTDGTVKILSNVKDASVASPANMVINVVFTVAADAAAGDYAIAISNTDACDLGEVAGEELVYSDENAITLTATNGAVKVAAPVTDPVLDENIATLVHGAGLRDTAGINFKFDLNTLSADATDFTLEIKRKAADASFNFVDNNTTIETFNKSTNGGFIQFSYYGIELYSLAVPITYTLHCFDAEGKEIAYSKDFTTTFAEVAVAYHDLATTGANAKKAMADLVMVGAAAQKFYNSVYATSEYAGLDIPSITSDYVSTSYAPVAVTDAPSGIAITAGGSLGAAPYFNFRWSGNVADKANYRVDVSFTDPVTKNDTTLSVNSNAMNGNATTINAKFDKLPLYAGNTKLTVKVIDISGAEESIIGTTYYSMDTYVASQANSSNALLKTVLQEIAELSAAARTVLDA